MPKKYRKSKKRVVEGYKNYSNPEDVYSNVNLNQLTSYLPVDYGLNSLPAVPASDEIVSYELLKKAAGDDVENMNIVKKFEQEDAQFLFKSMKMIDESPELQTMFKGRSMQGARAIAGILKRRAQEKELAEIFDDEVDKIVENRTKKKERTYRKKLEDSGYDVNETY